ncbi:MAG: GNAT family N-acetyltransferase [Anaerolineaceae bacterium]|nr:GNAT family N-acetyltransferase [Anaerolineaceae bacterium]
MNLEVVPAVVEDKIILQHLLELCMHDYSQYSGEDVDRHGLFGYPYLDHYWTEEGRHAFLFRTNGKLAGFALVRRVVGGETGEMMSLMAEFFVLRKYRAKGLGDKAAAELFNRFPGTWRVGQEISNQPAQAFWRKVIERYTGGNFREVTAEDWAGPMQEFQSPGGMGLEWQVSGPELGLGAECEALLRLLPDWFGIEDAIVRYGQEIGDLPTWIARDESGQLMGFLTVKKHSHFSAEIYVMGVRPETHHKGVGRALTLKAEGHLRSEGVEFLQVKTVGPSSNDPFYARTRAFYVAAGFRPLEELKQVWDEANPCLILVKRL